MAYIKGFLKKLFEMYYTSYIQDAIEDAMYSIFYHPFYEHHTKKIPLGLHVRIASNFSEELACFYFLSIVNW